MLDQDASVLGGTLSLLTDAEQDSDTGDYGITPSGLSSGNYDITYDDGNLAVTPAPLSVAALDQSKTYGDPDFSLGSTAFTVEGLVNGDRVDTVDLDSLGEPPEAPAAGSPYVITASNAAGRGLSVDDIANYDITYDDGNLAVTPAPLSVAALDQSKTYGDPDFSLGSTAFTVEGLVNGDRVDTVDLDSLGEPPEASAAGSPYAITASNAAGRGLSVDGIANYDITYQTRRTCGRRQIERNWEQYNGGNTAKQQEDFAKSEGRGALRPWDGGVHGREWGRTDAWHWREQYECSRG